MKITLHPYREEFLPAAHRWRQEPLTLRHNPLREVSEFETARFFESEASSFEEIYQFSAHRWFFKVDGALVGTVSFQNISPTMGYGEIGYMIGAKYHGRGLGTACIRKFLNELFHQTEIRRVFALVHDENTASCRLLERLGFTREGVMREHYMIQGEPVNEVVYGLLRREWEGWATVSR